MKMDYSIARLTIVVVPIDLRAGFMRLATIAWNWDVGAEFRISIKKPELQGLRP